MKGSRLGRPRQAIRRPASGQAAIEFVLVLPVIAIVLMALVQVALLASDRVAVSSATGRAARIAAVTGDERQIRGPVTEAFPGRPAEVVVAGDRVTGGMIRVTVRVPVSFAVPLMDRLLPRSVLLESSTVCAVEQP